MLTCLLALQRAQFSAALKQDPERRAGDLGTEVDGQTLHLSTAPERLCQALGYCMRSKSYQKTAAVATGVTESF